MVQQLNSLRQESEYHLNQLSLVYELYEACGWFTSSHLEQQNFVMKDDILMHLLVG